MLSGLDINYKLYHDLYVPNEKGGTTQIDHVVTSPYGIFVIETKHYDGWILGQENQKYWTQVIYKRKEKLYNPIWQNYGHIQALKKYIGKEDFEPTHSIIAFLQQSERTQNKSSELQTTNQALEGLVIEDKKEKQQ